MSSVCVNIRVVCLVWMLMLQMLLACGADIKEPDLQYPKDNGLPATIIEQLYSLESGQQGEESCLVIPRDVRFTRYSEKSGFHRDIHSSVTVLLDPTHHCSTCELLMIENLPKDLFVDVYQAAGAVMFGGPKVLALEEIDLEKPAYLSGEHTVLVYPPSPTRIPRQDGDVTVNFTAKLTVHLRYQRPSVDADTRSVRVSLPAPHLLMKCKGESTDDPSEEKTDVWPVHKAPCDATSGTTCQWQLLPQEGTKELYFDVPVGQQRHAFVVTAVTILATLVGTAALLVTMTRKPTDEKPD